MSKGIGNYYRYLLILSVKVKMIVRFCTIPFAKYILTNYNILYLV